MNNHTAKALLLDAFYQVLDNKVFRILIIIALCFIALTFLIAFKTDEVSILFGWKTLRYDDLGVAGMAAGSKELNVVAIQNLQQIIVNGLAGSFGIMLSLAATAFFVPRMLEKGEADILFSKPVGRFLLLIARYASGVLFVGVLASVLVIGMHLGFLLRSGYSDPAFLWSVLTLVYVFALIHAFATLVGVWTRSSIAALLSAILFFGLNGCVHGIWLVKEHSYTSSQQEADATDDAEAQRDFAKWDEPFLGSLVLILDGVHFVLPKTHDADVLTNQLRRAVSAPEFVLEDRGGSASFARNPKGFVRTPDDQTIDLAAQPVVWTTTDTPSNPARITVSRRTRVVERAISGKSKSTRTSDATAAREFIKTLEGRKDLEGKPELERNTTGRAVRMLVVWTEKRESGLVRLGRAFYGSGDWMYEIEFEYDATWKSRDDAHDVLREFLIGVTPRRVAASELDAGEWYSQQVGWTAPLRYNAGFSILTSILFALAMLFLARWKLSRIDF